MELAEVDCVACTETLKFRDTTALDGSIVCHDCVGHIFKEALDKEENYPPTWGTKVLAIKQFTFLPHDLWSAFKLKEKEYLAPAASRIYCDYIDPDRMIDIGEEEVPCGSYVGRIHEDWVDNIEKGLKCHLPCKACGTLYCVNCGEQFLRLHICKNPGPAKEDMTAFEGLIRGKDYQICPSETCHCKVELRDGCNHMKCTCGKTFCFICGEANPKSDHCSKKRDGESACPRFGHPDKAHAVYDPVIDRDAEIRRLQREIARTQADLNRFPHRRNAIVDLALVDDQEDVELEDQVARHQLRRARRVMDRDHEIERMHAMHADLNARGPARQTRHAQALPAQGVAPSHAANAAPAQVNVPGEAFDVNPHSGVGQHVQARRIRTATEAVRGEVARLHADAIRAQAGNEGIDAQIARITANAEARRQPAATLLNSIQRQTTEAQHPPVMSPSPAPRRGTADQDHPRHQYSEAVSRLLSRPAAEVTQQPGIFTASGGRGNGNLGGPAPRSLPGLFSLHAPPNISPNESSTIRTHNFGAQFRPQPRQADAQHGSLQNYRQLAGGSTSNTQAITNTLRAPLNMADSVTQWNSTLSPFNHPAFGRGIDRQPSPFSTMPEVPANVAEPWQARGQDGEVVYQGRWNMQHRGGTSPRPSQGG